MALSSTWGAKYPFLSKRIYFHKFEKSKSCEFLQVTPTFYPIKGYFFDITRVELPKNSNI